MSRAKYLVSVRKLQEEGERRVFPKNLAKYRNSIRKFSRVTGERIPFFHPGASRCITRDKCSNKYFTEHASRKRSAEINPNRYGGKCSRPFKYLKKHGRLKFVLPPGRSQIFAKPVMNICIEDLCKFVYVNMREREREKEFERVCYGLICVLTYRNLYPGLPLLFHLILHTSFEKKFARRSITILLSRLPYISIQFYCDYQTITFVLSFFYKS